MKKLLLFAWMAFAISCSKEAGTDKPQTPDQPSEQPEMVTVSFAMQGDVTIEEDPLSRAAGVETESTDLYGVNIYYDEDKDGLIRDLYGYGLFDNVADMTVSLLTGHKYKFICSLVKDGKNKIVSTDADGRKAYQRPFIRSDQGYKENTFSYDRDYPYQETILENKFVLGTGDHLTGLGRGYSSVVGEGPRLQIPPTDRYYGETTDYTPTEGGVVNISLKRCVFGMKFVVTGVTDGSFSFDFGHIFGHNGITSDTTYEAEIFTVYDLYDCWKRAMAGEKYYEDWTIFMTWERGNGVTHTFERVVELKRNVMTTINIRLNGVTADNSFNLDVETAEMGETNVDLDIDAGGMTPVE